MTYTALICSGFEDSSKPTPSARTIEGGRVVNLGISGVEMPRQAQVQHSWWHLETSPGRRAWSFCGFRTARIQTNMWLIPVLRSEAPVR